MVADHLVTVQQEDHCKLLPSTDHTWSEVSQKLVTTATTTIAVRATSRTMNACQMQVMLEPMTAVQERVRLILR
jgi:hypothetical protein